VSDHDDEGPNDAPDPVNLDDWRHRPDRTKEPIRDGYRLDDDGTLYDIEGRQRCSAKARNAPGGVCHTHRVKGQKRCRMHGGTSTRAKEKAHRDRVEADMRDLVAMMDMGPIHDPLTALKELAGEVVAWKDAMRTKVGELDTLSYEGEYGETAKAVVQLFERAMDRATDVLTKIARLNIDERLAAVTESQAKKIEDAFFAALDEAGIPALDIPTREKVAVAYARHLSVIPA
jgi:hypothetical protein